MLTRRTGFDAVSLGAVAVVAASLLSACGSESGDSKAEETKSNSPGAQFTGTYEAVITTLTVNAKPPDPKDTGARPSTRTWVVRSTCDGPGDSCMAIAADTDPGKGALTLDRMEFIYENGSWTRVVEPAKRDCTANATRKVVDEPWVALHSTTLKAPGSNATGPIASLTGTIESIQGGTCFGLTRGEVTLRRTGELPADATPLEKAEVPAAVIDPPGAALRGQYSFVNTVLRATPPSYAKPYEAAQPNVVLTPMCTRDGARCVTTLSSASGEPLGAMAFTDGRYERISTGPTYSCGGDRSGYSTQVLRISTAGSGAAPAASASATSDVEYLGDCPGSVGLKVALTRAGD